jgi:hypothetical protein
MAVFLPTAPAVFPMTSVRHQLFSCLLPPVSPLRRKQLNVAIEWDRYGELSGYDRESGLLVLGPDPAKAGV